MWGIISGLFVLAAWAIHASLSGAGVTFTAWHWIALVLWLLWTSIGVAVVWTFLLEREPRAAGVSAVFFGAVSTVSAAILALIFRGFSA
jgi:hypothetical protein